MTAQTGSVPADMDFKSAYATTFAPLANKTRYAGYDADVKSMVEMRTELNEQLKIGLKATSTTSGGAGTAGYALVPVYVDPQIVDRTRKFTPLTEIVPRVTNQGMYADYNIITAKGGAFVAGEDASLAETNTTYDRASTAIKFLYAVGRVTGPAQAAIPAYQLWGFQPSGSGLTGGFGGSSAPNALQMEVLVKAREIKELEEELIINGSVSDDANEFDGIIAIQSTTNKVDKNTTLMTFEDINTAIQYAYDDGGRPNFAVCSSSVYTDLLNLLVNKIGYLQSTQTVFWGFQTIVLNTMVGQVPVVPSMFMSNASGSKAIYFLDLSVWEMRVLQDMTFEKLAKTNDSDKFMLKMYETLICRAPAFNSFIGEIA